MENLQITTASDVSVIVNGSPVQAPSTGKVARQAPAAERSVYLSERLLQTPDRNLFNHVKFHLVKQVLDRIGIDNPAILDVGCGTQVARRYLTEIGLQFRYFGIDYEPDFKPDALVDLLNPAPPAGRMPWQPDVVMMLDVLEHLTEDRDELVRILDQLSSWIPDTATVIVTLPQMYRLDRFKLPHLHYAEHKIRLRREEWMDILGNGFELQFTQGLGYLSVIPYLPMASRRYHPENRLGSLFNHLRSRTFEWGPLKPADLLLSNSLGRLPFCKGAANDVLYVLKPRRSS
ncbi:MAG: methyltransferase [Gammaproteobacteria bacterium]|nr:MAG: methyltransferase [Gammaproteobacteria bacterium]